MGLLDQVIGGILGQAMGGGRGGAMSPIVKALLMILIAKAASGGLGQIFGGGPASSPAPQGRGQGPSSHQDDGDLGGFASAPAPRGGGSDGGFGDLAGMLGGGPGQSTAGQANPGPHAELDNDPSLDQLNQGLGGLIQSFERSGLGDVIGSWIGTGQNQSVQPGQLDQALGGDTLDALIRQTGMSKGELLNHLAQALPGVIDALTPNGRRP